MRLCDAPRRPTAKSGLPSQGVRPITHTRTIFSGPADRRRDVVAHAKEAPNEDYDRRPRLACGRVRQSDAADPASAADTIKIGEINSYSGAAGLHRALSQGLAARHRARSTPQGGVDGKKLEVISKDDGGKPADAVTAANELVANEGVALLAGTFFSNVGLAVADFAKQKKVSVRRRRAADRRHHLVEGQPLHVPPPALELRAGGDARRRSGQTAGQALGDDRAELRIRPVGGGGVQEAAFSAKRPDIQWVGEQWPPQGKIDAGAVLEAIDAAKPDAILNVDLRRRSGEAGARGQHARHVPGPQRSSVS